MSEVGKWLPGNAASALVQLSIQTGPNSTATLLSAWAGGLLFLGYGLAFALAGSLTTVRRDIT